MVGRGVLPCGFFVVVVFAIVATFISHLLIFMSVVVFYIGYQYAFQSLNKKMITKNGLLFVALALVS